MSDDKLTVDVTEKLASGDKAKYSKKIPAVHSGYKLTPDPNISSYTEQVEQWFKDEAKLYPKAMKGHLEHLKKVRATRKNKYGATTDGSLRYGLSLPPLTYKAIKSYYPEILQDKFYIESIMHRLPGLRTCDTV